MALLIGSTSTGQQSTALLHASALMSPCQSGTVLAGIGIGSTWVSPWMSQWRESRKMAVRYKLAVMGCHEVIILSLKLVKGKNAEQGEDTDASSDVVPHCTKVTLDLLNPWLKALGPPRLVAADSYFACVPAIFQSFKWRICSSSRLLQSNIQCHAPMTESFFPGTSQTSCECQGS